MRDGPLPKSAGRLLLVGASLRPLERIAASSWDTHGFAPQFVEEPAKLQNCALFGDLVVVHLRSDWDVRPILESCRHAGVEGVVVAVEHADAETEVGVLEAGADECVSIEALFDERLFQVLRRTRARASARIKVRNPSDQFWPEVSESAVHLRLALEASNTGLWAWDMSTDQVRWSTECYPILGVEDFAGNARAFFDLVHPEDRARVDQTVRAAAEERRRYACEFRVLRPDGEVAWVENRGRAFYDADGKPLRMLGTITDVTARQRAEDAAKDAERLTQAIIDGAHALIYAKDLEGKYFLFNRKWLEFVGLTAERARGSTDAELFGADAQSIRDNDALAISARAPRIVKESALVRGRQLTYLSSKFPLIDSRGEVYGVCGFSIDLTESEANQQALARRERELRQIADNSPDIFSRFDRELRHVFVSSAVTRATGTPVGAFIGKTNRDLGMPVELCDKWDAALSRVFSTAKPEALDFYFDVNGEARYFEAKLVPEFDDDGAVSHVLGVTRDVTQHHRYGQALREADLRKDEFIAILAHELRNPFATLTNGLELLKMEPSSPIGARACAAMERQLRHCTRLIEDLLDASGMALGKVTLRSERVELQAVIGDAVEATRGVIEGAEHTLLLHLEAQPLHVRGDISRLTQVVGNLLTNAAKYTPNRGTIQVRLSGDGSWALLEVSDTGVGIPAEQLEHVFVLFSQGKQASGSVKLGIGVGLAVVKSIVDLHRGSVAVQSEGPGRGSTFTVKLPLDLAM